MSDFLERYKPGQAIQQGTIGQAFTAIDLQRNRPVILKHLSCTTKEAAATVLQEWARLLPIRHPAIAQVFETDLDELDFYLALEYVEGNSLRRLISSLPQRAGEPDGLARILWSARATLEGLGALHAAQIAHSDLCPENIWLSERVILLDSGMAKLARLASMPEDARLRQAMNAIPIGSPAYRAPELALGAMPNLTSDIYSLGIVLYECLTGHVPGPEGMELPDELAENELLTNLLNEMTAFQPETRPNVTTSIQVMDELLRTPPALIRRLSRNRTQAPEHKPDAEEAELYQARAALLLATEPLERARLRRAIASYMCRKMSHSEALEECQAGFEDAENIDNPQLQARAMADLATVEMQVAFNKAQFEEVLKLAERAMGWLAKVGLENQPVKELARIHLKRARVYYRQGKETELKQSFETARTISQATDFTQGLAEADLLEAIYLGYTKGLLHEGISLAERSLETARQLDIAWMQSEALRVIGGCYQYLNDVPNADRNYHKALEVAERADLPDLMAYALYNLGLICEIKGDFDGCETFFLRALEMARKTQLPRPQAIVYKGLDLIYEQMGRLPEAYEYARLHLRMIQEINDQQLLPDANYQIASICLEMGRLEESEHFIEAGRELAAEIGNELILIELERLAANLLVKQERFSEAEVLLDQSRSRTTEQLSESLLLIDRVQLELELARLEARETEHALLDPRPFELVEAYRELAGHSERAFEDARAIKPSYEARFLALHGRIQALADSWPEAEATFKQAIQRADELKQRLSLALALHFYGLSLLERIQTGSTGRLGQRGRAIGLIANAKAAYAECAAQLGLDAVNQLLHRMHGKVISDGG